MPRILPASSCTGRIADRITSTTRVDFSVTTAVATTTPKVRIAM